MTVLARTITVAAVTVIVVHCGLLMMFGELSQAGRHRHDC